MTNYADILDGAADYIEAHGWHQGFFYPAALVSEEPGTITETLHRVAEQYAPPMCTMGAIAAQCNDMTEYGDTHEILATALRTHSHDYISIPEWNDSGLRTKGEVVELLRMEALKIRMGNIGDNPREYEFEPMPTTTPVVEPAAPQPVKEPVPA